MKLQSIEDIKFWKVLPNTPKVIFSLGRHGWNRIFTKNQYCSKLKCKQLTNNYMTISMIVHINRKELTTGLVKPLPEFFFNYLHDCLKKIAINEELHKTK